MSAAPIHLTPLLCPNCQAPVPAQPDEVAWLCDTCQHGLYLTADASLKPLEVFFSSQIPARSAGRPFWVSPGSVRFTQRDTYQGDSSKEAAAFWGQQRLFFIPAYEMPLDELVRAGLDLMRHPPIMQPGSPARFLPVVTPPEDLRPLAEFIVMAVEAARKDALKTVRFDLTLSPPQLWALP